MTTKIKLCAGWDTSENITKRLIDQFCSNTNISKKIKFVYDNSYDIIVYNNYINENNITNKPSYLFFHEPSWSGNHQKNIETNTIVFGYNREAYSCKNFTESFSHMFYGGRGSWCEGHEFWTYDNLLNNNFDQYKTKNISSIISDFGSQNDSYPYGCIYKNRYDCNKLLNSIFTNIDFFGSFGRNLNLKKDGLINYKFSLAIENANEKNYVSEKFYDPILVDTIPIYFGCKNIKDLWPQNGYILLDNITDTNYLIDKLSYILNNTDSLYHKMIKNTKEIKQQFLQKNNLFKRIESLCD